jgi:hypothetical protein
MDTNFHSNGNTAAGTVGGTFLVLLLQLNSTEIIKTVVLAAIGAAVSFTVSYTLKYLVRYLKKK